jgi:DNA-binding CsgD family transcriptional regulator
MIIEDYAAAQELLGRAVAAARSASAPGALPLTLAFLSELEFRTGHWTQAAAHAFEAARLAEETGQASLLGYALCCRARMDAACGREAEFKRRIAGALALGERFGIGSLRFLAGSGYALLLLPVGQSTEVIRQMELIARLVEEAGGMDPGVSPWQADFIEALIQAGRLRDAEAELASFEQLTGRVRRPGMLAISARCRGLLAADHEFEDEFAHALHWHEQKEMPFERARTELALGVRRRRVGRRLQAREPLRSAFESFDRLGARRWAEFARAELRATGEAVRPRDQTIVEELTAQELQVALAVGRGATNREAAEALFLSPKTIEYHLGHVYRKFGVRSRTELARLLAREDTGNDIAGHAERSAPAKAS